MWFGPIVYFRYFNYIFDSVKKYEANQDKELDSELTGLQVQITSTDSECDGYPSLKTDESCEFPFFLLRKQTNTHTSFLVCA